uniref:Uncharacterized protein n=1 Tax=Caenorhabditis japonica TaxID=281687 RepID=A0A8R1IMI2_CAEJA
MISTGPAQVQHYALVLLAKRGAWLLLAAQHNAAAVSTISARHQHGSSTISASDENTSTNIADALNMVREHRMQPNKPGQPLVEESNVQV